MLSLALLALSARALDLEVTYTVAQAVDPGVTAPADLSGYSRAWTLHDVDLAPPPEVLVECPGGGVCRVVLDAEPHGAEQVTITMAIQRMEVVRRQVRWETVSSPRVTTSIGQRASVEQGARVPVLVEGEVQFRYETVNFEVVPLD